MHHALEADKLFGGKDNFEKQQAGFPAGLLYFY
jgi:hypothetical protein